MIDRDPRNADWLKPSRDIAQGRFKTVVLADIPEAEREALQALIRAARNKEMRQAGG